ncbi:hypothetical protein GE09DRAFT_1092771 [Coniochaeta sp. 2T2.1]|nr:hypothetical protein GE09DRAFT_1092771 [Coniochaeta sp. 2T2.1]
MPQQQQQQPQQQQQGDGYGPQTRPMGLKVQYTFDRDGQVNCLARWPHILHIQTVPLDDRTSIGVIDLRTCLNAVAQCSPEIINQQDFDYTVYATDYSEPDVPLVGQGMLSWGLDPNNDPQSQQLVTGRVTRNLMALFGKGNSDTLEVRLKLTPVPKMQHRAEPPRSNTPQQHQQHQQHHQQHQLHQQHQHQPHQHQHHQTHQHHHTQSFTSQPDAANSEWNSLIDSNPNIGHSSGPRFPSPQIPQARMNNSTPDTRFAQPQPEHQSYQQSRPSSTAPTTLKAPPPEKSLPPLPQQQQQTPPTPPAQLPPPPTSDIIGPEKPARPSRPASRQRSRATGRPRGRPRKKPLDGGHTSGAEMTDGDDGPKRKRAKVIPQADYNTTAPFSSHPDSLRVAASTSGSLRNMRPVGAAGGLPAGNHLQDVPRAPTPVPNASQQQQQQTRQPPLMPRQNSMSGLEAYQMQQTQPSVQTSMSMVSMFQDARSPTDSIAQSPEHGYTPDQSPADLGSSPPVPRTSAFPRSSPAPSSPTLPPVDSGFMSGGMEDFFDEDDMGQDLAAQDGLPDLLPKLPLQKPAPQRRRQQRQEIMSDNNFSQPQQTFLFHEVNPGPQELLPQTSRFIPAGPAKPLNRVQAVQAAQATIIGTFEAKGPPAPAALPPTRRQLQLQRSHTAPVPQRYDPGLAVETPPLSKAPFEVPVESVEQADTPTSKAPQVQEPTPQADATPFQPQTTVDESSIKRRPSQPDLEPFTRSQEIPAEEQSSLAPAPVTDSAMAEAPAVESPVLMAPVPEPLLARPPAFEPNQREARSEPFHAILAPPAATSAPQSAPTSQEPQSGLALPPMRPASPRTKSLPPPPVPASDPVMQTFLSLPPLPEVPQSEGPCPPGEDEEQPKASKNFVKKQSIKDRLETAIAKGEMPPFCNNCGAIETPTWRKIWTQEHHGAPGFYEFSDKPGCVTCIDVLEKTPQGQPTLYRLVKKNLGSEDLRLEWKELLLCNRKCSTAT